MKVSTGDWVELKNRENFRGFVINVYNDPDGNKLSIRLSKPEYLVNKCLTIKEEEAIKLSTELLEEDLNCLIDLALQLKDKTWFKELSKHYSSYQRP